MQAFRPHDYQNMLINKMINQTHVGLFVDMGMGKTVSTLTALEQLLYDYLEINKVLLIAPTKVAESTWQDEAKTWSHTKHLRISTVLGSSRQRIKALQTEADIYIINRENTKWLIERYEKKPTMFPFDTLVIDESSSFKNPQAKRFKALKKFRGFFKRVYLLTGTPSPNNLMDLWPQLYLLDGGERLGRTIGSYRDCYFTPDKMNGHIVYSYKLKDKQAEDVIYKKISDICVSLKSEDYLNLKEAITVPHYVRLSDNEMTTYKQMERDLFLEVNGEELVAVNAAVLQGKLLQLANGAAYTDEKKTITFHEEKLRALDELLEAADSPVLLFYSFKFDKDRILERYKEAEEYKGPESLTKWNEGKIPLLVAHPASTAYGLNLQRGGHIIVWYGLTQSLELYQQANKRLHRQGQTKPVIIHQLLAKGTADEITRDSLERKEKGQDYLLEQLKARLEEYKDAKKM